MKARSSKTLRELGGEMWAEIMRIQVFNSSSPLAGLTIDQTNAVVDLIMGVLARHEGKSIAQDKDLPVAPLPADPQS